MSKGSGSRNIFASKSVLIILLLILAFAIAIVFINNNVNNNDSNSQGTAQATATDGGIGFEYGFDPQTEIDEANDIAVVTFDTEYKKIIAIENIKTAVNAKPVEISDISNSDVEPMLDAAKENNAIKMILFFSNKPKYSVKLFQPFDQDLYNQILAEQTATQQPTAVSTATQAN